MHYAVTLNFDSTSLAAVITSISGVVARRPDFDWQHSLPDLVDIEVSETGPDALAVRLVSSARLIAMSALH